MSVQMFTQGQKHDIFAELKNGATVKATARKWYCSEDTIRRVRKEIEKFNASKPVVQDVGATPLVKLTPVEEAIAKLKARAEALAPKTAPHVVIKVDCDVAGAIAKGREAIAKADVAIARLDAVIEAKKPELVWTMGANFINIVADGQTFVANNGHQNFDKARQAIFDGQIEQALNMINVKKGIEKYAQGKIKIEKEEVFYGDLKIDTGLTKRIVDAMGEGKEFKFLVNFFENLMLNPSRRAVNELFGFLEHNDIELTEDGHFLAWKRVESDYMDMYTKTIDNSPGKIVEVARNQVDEDSNRTCSAGLHVAAKSYLPHYGGGRGVIIQVKVHPRDVVSIPVDYNNAKMRCSRYEVMKDVTEGFSHY